VKNQKDIAIEVEHLRKIFYSVRGFWKQQRKTIVAVDDISFQVCKGELFGIVGPNGAGKTTTVKMLSTLLIPSDGKAKIFGLDVQDNTNEIRSHIGFAFGGNKGLYGRLSALDNLRYFAELYKLPPKNITKRIMDLIEIVGLAGRENDRVETYSNGMQQRLHIARALLHDPDLIYLDEPTVGIDPVGAREIRQLIRNMINLNKTVVLTSHYMYEMEELCDRIAVVDHGKVVALDTPSNLKSRSAGDSIIGIQISGDRAKVQQIVASVANCLTHVQEAGDTFTLSTKTPSKVINAFSPLLEQDLIRNIEVRNATLEDVYIQIIKNGKA
jgi:ABC-2 type transport system ATP-binding protein